MDDQQTYLLNGLLTRQFGLGRIVRFRQVKRGRQAATYEVMTAQQNEYMLYLYPPAYRSEQLRFVAGVVNGLDRERFTVVPMVAGKGGDFIGEGPQGTHLMVSLATQGSPIEAGGMTVQEVAQVGLRLAWMHRLLTEHVELPDDGPSMAGLVAEALEDSDAGGLSAEGRATLLSALGLPLSGGTGWVHGDVQADALLHDGDRQLRTVVDWGLLHVGSQLEDVVDGVWNVCGDGKGGVDGARAAALLEAYGTLLPLKAVSWTAAVAMWCGRRVIDASAGRRTLPAGWARIAGAPEGFGVALASWAV